MSRREQLKLWVLEAVLETGEARELHHFAVLIGYGANAINPYLAFETIEHEINKGNFSENLKFKDAQKNFLIVLLDGVLPQSCQLLLIAA